jgi:hypothetical protein
VIRFDHRMMEVAMAERPNKDWREQVLNMAEQAAAGFTPAPTVTVPAPTPFSAGPQLQPQFDVIELLPPDAQERLRMLRQRAADAHALIPEFESIREASMAKIEAANALKRLTNHPQDGGFDLKPDDRRVVEAQRTLDKATADFKRLQELQEVRSAAWQTASAALANVGDWLRHGKPADCVLEAVETAPPKLNKGREHHRWHRALAPTRSRTEGRLAQDRERAVPVELRQAARARTDRGIGDAGCAGCLDVDRARPRDRLADAARDFGGSRGTEVTWVRGD